MENNQSAEIFIKDQISRKEISIAISLILLQIGLSFIIVKSEVHNEFAGNQLGVALLYKLVLTIVSIIGLVSGIGLLKKRNNYVVPILLFIVSIASFPVINSRITSSISHSLVHKARAPERERQKEYVAQRAIKEKEEYEKIVAMFQEPKKIVVADLYDDMYPVLVLDDDNIIALPELGYEKKQQYVDFISWINEHLINKQVQIILPTYEEHTLGAYIGISLCDDGIPALVEGIREKFHIESELKDCTLISANDIYYNNESLYKKYFY